ncbi:putative ran gtpase-activating protein, partial [Danaus plexippus plexippus]
MSFDLNSISKALNEPNRTESGVDFSGRSLKLDSEQDAQPIIEAINACPNLHYLTLTGNTLGVEAAKAIAKALSRHPELKVARFSDMFTGRMKTEIPPALSALGDGMIEAGARLTLLDLSDNAFGPIGVEGLAKLLQSEVCSELQLLRDKHTHMRALIQPYIFPGLSIIQNHLERLSQENDVTSQIVNNICLCRTYDRPFEKQYAMERFCKLLENFKTASSITFKSIELSHNEIGREACMQLVEALTIQPGAKDRLTRVNLAGNSLGGAANKKIMKDKLGASAELSDGEGSDEEYESESEHSDYQSGASEDSATEDARHVDTSLEEHEDLDRTGIEEVETDIGRFLKDPTLENLSRLGGDIAEVIDAHLQNIKDPESLTVSYVEALCCVWGASEGDSQRKLCRTTIQRAPQQWILANNMLRALQLIK